MISEEFFNSPHYPLSVLYDVATFYDKHFVPEHFLQELDHPTRALSDKRTTAIVWFCYTLGIHSSDAKVVLQNLSSSRLRDALAENRGSQKESNSREPVDTNPTPSGAKLQSSVQNIDFGRVGRLENLHRRNRASKTSSSDRMKQTSYVNSYFTNKQFSGDLSQSIELTLRDYRHCSVLYELDDQAMATNFSAALRGPARAFHLSNIKKGMPFSDTERFMSAEYNSSSRQIQVRRNLDALRINGIMNEKGLCSEEDALKEIINRIETLVPQCPPAFRNDENKISFLRHPVIRQPWARNAVAKVEAETSHGFNSQLTFTQPSHCSKKLNKTTRPQPTTCQTMLVTYLRRS